MIESKSQRRLKDSRLDSRALSDGALIESGAEYSSNVLRPTHEQVKQIRSEFIDRDRTFATRAVFMSELIRDGAYHQDGVLLVTPDQIELLRTTANYVEKDDSALLPRGFTNDTVPMGDLLSAHRNELQLDADAHTILQPYLAMIATNTPRKPKSFFGDKKRTVEWDVSRRLSQLPDVIIRSKTTYEWANDTYQPSNHRVLLGISEENIKNSEDGYHDSYTMQISLYFKNGTLSELTLRLPANETALRVALQDVDMFVAPISEHIAAIHRLGVGIGADKKLQIDNRYMYLYDNVENRFVATTGMNREYPHVLPTEAYEGLVRNILSFVPTTTY